MVLTDHLNREWTVYGLDLVGNIYAFGLLCGRRKKSIPKSQLDVYHSNISYLYFVGSRFGPPQWVTETELAKTLYIDLRIYTHGRLIRISGLPRCRRVVVKTVQGKSKARETCPYVEQMSEQTVEYLLPDLRRVKKKK